MGLYNFHKRFVPKILSGEKTHTIRAHRANPDRPGNTLHLYTGLRRKGARLLGRYPCVKVETITITPGGLFPPMVYIDGQDLDVTEVDAFARRDGFENFADMIEFWEANNELPFTGNVIHWKKEPVCKGRRP